MDDEGLHIRHVRQQREYLQAVDKRLRLFHSAFYLEGEDGTATIGEILLIKRVVGMLRQRGVVDGSYPGMMLQKVHHLQGILHMALYAER